VAGTGCVGRAQAGELFDQDFDVLAQQRLAPGQADFANTTLHKHIRQPGDFLEREQGAVRQVGIVFVEDFLGHAVIAAEVAAVSDTDAQVVQRALKPVQRVLAGDNNGSRQRQAGVTLVDQRDDSFGHTINCAAARVPMRQEG